MSGRDVGLLAGGPFKPAFGLSGAVLRQEKVFPRLVRAFVPSSLIQFPPALHNLSRSGENCSIPSLPDVHTIPPLLAFTPASQKRARWGPRIAMNVAKLLNELHVITNVEIVVPFLPEMLRIADQPPRHALLQRFQRCGQRLPLRFA